MTTRKTYREEMLDEARRKRQMADKAERQGDKSLRDAFLRQAADRYRAADQIGMALFCERFIGK